MKKYFKKLIFYFAKISSKIKRKTKNILLVTRYSVYDEHIIKYYDNFCNKENINFYIIDVDYNYDRLDKQIKGRNIKPIKSSKYFYFFILFKGCNLIVTPCHLLLDNNFTAQIPALFIYHGTSTNLHDGELFAYNKKLCILNNKLVYDKMLENNKLLKIEMEKDPLFKGKIEYVSSQSVDIITENLKNYHQFRNQLNVSNEELFVFIYSTWGENSLFYKLGTNFLSQLKNITKLNGKNVKFALSIHPREYTLYDGKTEPFAKKIDDMQSENIIVRNPGEDWINYIIGSDIIIGDHSSMLDFAILAEKKIILSETDLQKISKFSIVSKAYEKLKVINKDSNLQDELNLLECADNLDTLLLKSNIGAEKGFYSKRITEITNELLKR